MPHDPGAAFRALHRPGDPSILVNVWDAGTARMMAAMGAEALATSSAAHAFTLGRPDMGQVSRDEALAHARMIVAATPLPVQGDFENGFGESPKTCAETVRQTCAETVRLAAEAGLAGICIEDTDLPGTGAYAFDLAVERIAAAARAARALRRDFVLTARADGVMLDSYDFDEALRRAIAFAEAGADCLYVPLPGGMANIGRLCAATSKPVNVLAAGPDATHSRAEFAAAGVARISLGSALARVTHRALHETAEAFLGRGDFTPLGKGLAGSIVDALLTKDP